MGGESASLMTKGDTGNTATHENAVDALCKKI